MSLNHEIYIIGPQCKLASGKISESELQRAVSNNGTTIEPPIRRKDKKGAEHAVGEGEEIYINKGYFEKFVARKEEAEKHQIMLDWAIRNGAPVQIFSRKTLRNAGIKHLSAYSCRPVERDGAEMKGEVRDIFFTVYQANIK